MAPYTPIGVDPSYHFGAQAAMNQQRYTGQQDFYSVSQGLANYLGPVGIASAGTWGSQNQADITYAAVSATANNNPGMYSGSMAQYGAGVGGGLVGGAGPSALTYGGPGPMAVQTDTADLMETARMQLAESQASSLALIGVQQEMGQIAQFHQSLSTVMARKDQLSSEILRNWKG